MKRKINLPNVWITVRPKTKRDRKIAKNCEKLLNHYIHENFEDFVRRALVAEHESLFYGKGIVELIESEVKNDSYGGTD